MVDCRFLTASSKYNMAGFFVLEYGQKRQAFRKFINSQLLVALKYAILILFAPYWIRFTAGFWQLRAKTWQVFFVLEYGQKRQAFEKFIDSQLPVALQYAILILFAPYCTRLTAVFWQLQANTTWRVSSYSNMVRKDRPSGTSFTAIFQSH